MKPLVLVGFAEALSAPEVVWSLRDQGFDVLAFARRGRRCALRHSRHVSCREITAPESDAEVAVADLRSLMASVRAGKATKLVLFPLDDNAVWVCNRVSTEEECIMAGPRGDAAELALDKYAQTQMALAAGFDVPATTLLEKVEDLGNARLQFPLIMKPAKAIWVRNNRFCGGKAWICASREELEKAAANWAGQMPLLAQPFILGTGCGVFGLADETGVRAWSAHRRLRMMNPQGSGASACISQPVPRELKTPVERFIKRIGWRGLFMIELLRDHAGKDWFVEFNGRPWGSMALARRQTLEYPAWNVRLALDPRDQAGRETPTATNMVCRNLAREFLHLLFVLRGPRSAALREWPSFWKAVAGVFGIRRGDCIYNWRRDDPKVLLSDCYYTIRESLFKPRR